MSAADVRDVPALTRAVDSVVARHGRLDAVVAAAGAVAGGAPLWETDDDTWRAMVEVNLTGVFNTVRATVPHLLAAPRQDLSDCRKYGITLCKVVAAISRGLRKIYLRIAGFDRVPRVRLRRYGLCRNTAAKAAESC